MWLNNVCVCYLELLKGIRVETVIIPLSLTCHYCLFSSTACVSASADVRTYTRKNAQLPTNTHTHTPVHSQRCFWQFLCLMENTFYLSLPEASPLLPRSLERFHLLTLPSLQPVALCSHCHRAFSCSKSVKTQWMHSATGEINVKNTIWRICPLICSLNCKHHNKNMWQGGKDGSRYSLTELSVFSMIVC